jgi:hypothetical protein
MTFYDKIFMMGGILPKKKSLLIYCNISIAVNNLPSGGTILRLRFLYEVFFYCKFSYDTR